MATQAEGKQQEPLDEKSLRRLENGVLYALAASSTKLKIAPGTRISDPALAGRTLADLYIVDDRVGWMWDHIDYAVSLIKRAKKVDRTSAEAQAAETVAHVWAVVLAAQPGAPKP